MTESSRERLPVKSCHVCEGTRIYYLFSSNGFRAVRCEDCGLVFLNPQPSDEELARIYGGDYFRGAETKEYPRDSREFKEAEAREYLSQIRRYRGATAGRLLEVGCGDGHLLSAAEAEGWDVCGIEYTPAACDRARGRLKKGKVYCGELKAASLPGDQMDIVVVSDIIANVRSPCDFLHEIHRVLKPGGTLFITTPSIDSWSARLRKDWTQFKAEHLTYFDRQTLQTALFRSGFREIIVEPAEKFLSDTLPRQTPQPRQRVVAGGITAFARKVEIPAQPVLSVIVPAYNEAKTFETMMNGLLRKELPGLRKEIIVVESNSTDGTRQIVEQYRGDARVKLVFEERPRGKGHAVRAGLKAASGDYVLIQDADLEYDFEDYDALLEPLLSGRAAFVLGSRHGGRNVLKMREFSGQLGLSLFFNFGHWLFTELVNALYRQRLSDPFTMFKVFRRDCLFGLEFECDRFDFDFELLIKLIRKGYRPAELPVNYRSRSYKEGKKVRLFLDPFDWLKTLVRLRFVKVDPMNVAERTASRELFDTKRVPRTPAIHK